MRDLVGVKWCEWLGFYAIDKLSTAKDALRTEPHQNELISELGLSVVAGSDVLSPVWWQRWRYRELPLAGAPEVGAESGYVWQWGTPKFQWNIIIFPIRWGLSYHIMFILGDKMWGLTINRDIFPMSWRLSDYLGFSLPSGLTAIVLFILALSENFILTPDLKGMVFGSGQEQRPSVQKQLGQLLRWGSPNPSCFHLQQHPTTKTFLGGSSLYPILYIKWIMSFS